MGTINIKGFLINTEKVLVQTKRKTKTIGDYIKEIQPNFERVVMYARKTDSKPFKDKESLKKWLIANQEGYNKFNKELFVYFSNKCNF
jgi:hypothetical protein